MNTPPAAQGALPQDLRFYPPETRPFAGEPSRRDFAIRPAGSRGEGLVALRAFAPGESVFTFTGDLVPHITQFTLQMTPDLHIHDPYVMGKVLHHCAPNTRVDLEHRTFVATQAIAPGDFVTMDYYQTEDVLFKSFTCRCGAPQCRGAITGRRMTCNAPRADGPGT